MKLEEVRSMAKGLSITIRNKKKVDLIREFQRKEGNFDCYKTATSYCDQVGCCFRSDCIPKKNRK